MFFSTVHFHRKGISNQQGTSVCSGSISIVSISSRISAFVGDSISLHYSLNISSKFIKYNS